MTKIGNQVVYIPDTEISGLDYFIGTDIDQGKRTVNFRMEDVGSHFNMVNGVRNFDFNFYEHQGVNPKPSDGYFYSNGNNQDPNNITHFIFSKKTSRNKDSSIFFESIATDNPFDLIISQKVDTNTVFFFRINSIETFSNYYKLNVSEVFFPQGKEISYTLSYAIFNLKSEGVSVHNNLGGLNDGNYKHLTEAEKEYFDELPTKLQLKQNLPTGFVQGLGLSIHPTDNTKAIIGVGGYLITDFSDILNIQTTIVQVTEPIEFTPAFLLTNPSTYVALDIDKNVIPSITPFENDDRRTLCLIGNVVHSNNININVVNEIKAPIVAPTNQLHDLIKAVGFLNLEGNLLSPNGANLSLNKTSGKIWGLGINAQDYTDPHRLTLPSLTAFNFRYRLSDSTEYANTTVLNPTQYESSPGVLTALSNNNRWSIQHLNIFQSNVVRLQYGQHEYNSFVSARNAVFTESFNTEANIADNAIFRCYIVMKKTCTDLALDIANGDAEIIHVGKFGNAVGGGIASLTLANILATLGYTPENEANKQDGLEIDGTGLKYPTVDATNAGLATKQDTLTETNFGSFVNSLTTEDDIQDSDKLSFVDSSDSNKQKKTTWLNLKAKLTTVFNGLYQAILTATNFGAFVNGLTSKTTPVDVDQIGLMDSADSNNQKKLSWANLKSTLFNSDRYVDLRQKNFSILTHSTYFQPLRIVEGAGVLLTTTGTADDSGTGPSYGGNSFARWVRRRYVSAASAGSNVAHSTGSYKIVDFTNDGQFFVSTHVGNEDAIAVTTGRNFFGFYNASSFPNVNPSTGGDIFCLGNDSTDANMQIIHNDSSGTATKINLGSNFPANTVSVDHYLFQFWKFSGSTTIYYRVKNIHNGVEAIGNVTTDLPVSGYYNIILNRNNGSTASAVRLSTSHLLVSENR